MSSVVLNDVRLNKTLIGHKDRITSLCFNSDSKLILSGSFDSTVKLWDRQNGYCKHTFKEHTKEVLSVDVNKSGELAVSGGNDNSIKLLSISKLDCLQSLEYHEDIVTSVSFSPYGNLVLSGSYDETIKIWDVDKKKIVKSYDNVKKKIYSVRFNHDCSLIMYVGFRDIGLINVQSGETIFSIDQGFNPFLPARFSPDGRYIIARGIIANDKIDMKLISLHGDKSIFFEGHIHFIPAISFSYDGNFILSGSYDRTLKIWNAKTGECLRSIPYYNAAINSVCLSSDNLWAVSGGWDNTVSLWRFDWVPIIQ